MVTGRFSFKGGVHFPLRKPVSADLPIQTLPAPGRVVIPLIQHSGTAARPVARPNDNVEVGSLIAESGGPLSAPVHASVSGRVISVGPAPHSSGSLVMALEIENDGLDRASAARASSRPWQELTPEEILSVIVAGGIVEMENGGLPAQAAFTIPSDKPITTLIINGVEYEPSAAGHRLMLEKSVEVLTGTLILAKMLGAPKTWLAVRRDKRELLTVIKRHLTTEAFATIGLARMTTAYPGNDVRLLVKSLARREIPQNGRPVDCGCMVVSAATAYAVHNAVCKGIAVYERVITVAGPAVGKPANLLVRIGTPLRHVLEACGTDLTAVKKVAFGSSMRGIAQSSVDVPITKDVSGVFVTGATTPGTRRHACIRCGACVRVCPMRLVPSHIARLVERDRFAEATSWNVASCCECGSCAYVCPSKINLVHFMQLGKFNAIAEKVHRE